MSNPYNDAMKKRKSMGALMVDKLRIKNVHMQNSKSLEGLYEDPLKTDTNRGSKFKINFENYRKSEKSLKSHRNPGQIEN